jgi:predicted amidohydrolase
MKPYRDKIYNIASVFDRKGDIIGEYRKAHLPCNELFQVTEGDSIHTIDTDIGKIGVMICYDVMFPAMAEALSLQGAEIVFHPTYGYGWNNSIGEATLRARASDGSFYLVTAKDYRYNAAGKSSVIDFWGHVMADAGFEPNVFITAQIDLDRKKTQPDWFIQTGITSQPDMRIRHEGERRPDLYGAVCETAIPKYEIPSPGEQQEIFRDKLKKNILHW